ncbi:MAG: hypothetical protein NTY38_03420, partial [Acidobacteria bacterium]|nr:hypothetical protein [Acidobacteriota bacterium]
MTIARQLRHIVLSRSICAGSALYGSRAEQAQINIGQLRVFNSLWAGYIRTVPFWRDAVRRGGLPKQFKCWQQFADLMPISTRARVRENAYAMYEETRRPDWWRTTGGSTAEPVQLPAWRSETR